MLKKILSLNYVLMTFVNKTIYSIKEQRYEASWDHYKILVQYLDSFCKELEKEIADLQEAELSIEPNQLMQILMKSFHKLENEDYISMCDELEFNLLPNLITIQRYILMQIPLEFNEERFNKRIVYLEPSLREKLLQIKDDYLNSTEKEFRVEYTENGCITIIHESQVHSRYLITNLNPNYSAFQLALSWYDSKIDNYKICGLEGFWNQQYLYSLDRNIEIEIYESDLQIIFLAISFGDIDVILKKERVKLIYDEKYEQLLEYMEQPNEDTRVVVNLSSFQEINDIEVRAKLQGFLNK